MGPCPCGTIHKDDPEYLARQAGRGSRRAPSSERPKAEPAPSNVHSIGESPRAKISETYEYRSLTGDLLYEVCRMEPKSFRQRRKAADGSWLWSMKADPARGIPERKTTLYRIPELFAALDAGDTIFIVEGERDVESCFKKSLVATCNTGGAGKWRDELAQPFAKARGDVVIVRDRDDPGEAHARKIYESISAVLPEGRSVRIVESREGKDATDHFGSGLEQGDFVHVWPMSEEMLKTSPGIYKRAMLRQALAMPDSALREASENEVPEEPPHFLCPLKGDNVLDHLQGVVTAAGEPSSGKSYFAIACGVDNAMNPKRPWDVFYLNCEMSADYVIDRALRAAASSDLTAYECQSQDRRADAVAWAKEIEIPGRFTRVDIEIGVTMPEIIEYLAEVVGDLPTLVIMDSISSLVDNMEEVAGDSFGMSNLRVVQKYATAVRRLTKGHVAWLILSELNKEGRAKGRSLDHRSDMAIAMSPDKDRGHIKNLRVTKSWFGPTGLLGEFVLWHDIARLVKVSPDV